MQAIGQRFGHILLGYWSGPGFHRSHAICRIVLGALFVLSAGFFVRQPLASDDYLYLDHPDAAGFFWTNYASFFALKADVPYQPIGLLCLFGARVPPAALFDACYAVLCVSSWLVLVGLFSRISLLASVVCLELLFGLQYSFLPHWCHPPLGILLPALAMLVGPRSTALSLDALLDRWRGLDPRRLEEARLLARGPVLLAQLSLALIFASAGLCKAYLTSREPFAWVFSDNLRNLILIQHDKLGRPLPWLLQYAVAHSWVCRALALGNLLAQFAPLGACFCVRRPLLRALFGGVFLLEMLGLDIVMGICNPLWYPLLAFFIDWDRLFARGQAARLPLPQGTRAACQAAYAWVFLAFFIYVALFHVKARRWTYPFTCFQMYSAIHAAKPYNVHRPYPVRSARWEVEAEPPLTERERRHLNLRHAGLPWSGLDIDTAVRQVRRELEAKPGRRVTSVALDQVVLQVPPCSACSNAELAVCWSARVGMRCNGRKVAVQLAPDFDPKLPEPRYFRMKAEGFKDPQLRFAYYVGMSGKEMRPLRGRWRDDRYHFDKSGAEPYVIVALVRDEVLGGAEVPFMGVIYGP